MIKLSRLQKACVGSSISQCYGSSKIIGNIFKQGQAMQGRVRLHEKSTGKLICEKMTDDSGGYVFHNLNKLNFIVIATDPVSQFNAVIQDNVVPK